MQVGRVPGTLALFPLTPPTHTHTHAVLTCTSLSSLDTWMKLRRVSMGQYMHFMAKGW